MVNILANSLVPIFVGLLFGYLAGLRKIVDNKNVKSLIAFLMTFTLPCSLFVAIALAPRQLLWSQWKSALVLTIVYLAVYFATYYASKRKDTPAHSAVLALTIGFPNAAAVGIPVLTAVYGPEAAVSVAIAIAIGAITITPITLAILENGTSGIRASVLGALKKPVFWAPMLALLVAASSIPLPTYFNKSLAILGNATEGTALFVTGLIASAQAFKMDWAVTWSVIGKNVLMPALGLAVAFLLDTPLDQLKHVVLLTAIPSGFFGILFGEGFGAASARASSSLIASTVLCVFTLPAWIIILDRIL